MTSPSRTIRQLFDRRGDSEYGGEAVTQLEHALQAAMLAQQQNADDSLIVAALLHDVGHLLHQLPDDAPDQNIDDIHEDRAAKWLSRHFGPKVTEPVRMHVAAKRYMCTVEPDYLKHLSPPSLTSLKIQGGLMSPAEVAEFESSPHCLDAIRLRRWDDAAKVPQLPTPSLDDMMGLIDRVAHAEPQKTAGDPA